MDRSEVITLVSATTVRNEYGILEKRTTSREVFAQVDSVTRTEFFEGGRNGLNPELQFRMFSGDYNDEKEIVYNGRHYGVYRTYMGRNDVIELYTERKGGLNVSNQQQQV